MDNKALSQSVSPPVLVLLCLWAYLHLPSVGGTMGDAGEEQGAESQPRRGFFTEPLVSLREWVRDRGWWGRKAEQRHRCRHLLNMEELGLTRVLIRTGMWSDTCVERPPGLGGSWSEGWACRRRGRLDAGASRREDGLVNKSSAQVPAAATMRGNKETV